MVIVEGGEPEPYVGTGCRTISSLNEIDLVDIGRNPTESAGARCQEHVLVVDFEIVFLFEVDGISPEIPDACCDDINELYGAPVVG